MTRTPAIMTRFLHFTRSLALALVLSLPVAAFAQVDLNSASARALAEAMAGVGLVKAEAIVAYREQHGPFRSIDELRRVPGIGPKTLAANRGRVVVVQPPG